MRLRSVTDEAGSTSIEFALVSLPFVALMLFCLQIGIVFFAEQGLQSFNEDISRNILTGTTQKKNLNQSDFKKLVCASLPTLFSCSRLFVDIKATGGTSDSRFSSVDTSMPTLTFDASGNVTNTWNYNLGNPSDVVVVRMIYVWPVVGVVIGPGIANTGNNNREIISTTVFKNEKYQ